MNAMTFHNCAAMMRAIKILTTKMPSESPAVQAQTEKPQHYLYLKEFRTQQCPLFLQHKCTQHRPFTCFHWHFMNQRRRRPIRKRDGTFNYSPDVYCTKYDDTNGLCPDGDECPFLHRTAGDTERRYHLRYYKTGTCVYETDSKGNCVKNGPHCAFAHGAHDLRPPIYDIRELQAIETPDLKASLSSSSGTPSSLEKDKILAEDPKWNDTNYVLANYKTEPCKRPPRLCRQGYACPSYHNTRDRRRSPKKCKYRSTPCPNVKHGDDWGDPTQCENGDNCAYCHTRTEQQFHPEIYKSTKCNDMVQTGYCPRGPFCAFAHVEQEITTQRDVLSTSENSLAAFMSTVLPIAENPQTIYTLNTSDTHSKSNQNGSSSLPKLPVPIGKERANSIPYATITSNNIATNQQLQTSSPLPEPIGKGRSSSTSSSITSDSGFYQRAPGSEREDSQMVSMKLRQQLQSIDSDQTIDLVEKAKRKQNLLMLHSLTFSTSATPSPVANQQPNVSTMSPLAPAFYPPGDTVGSVIGHALDDLCLDDIDINSIDRELDKDEINSLSSSLSAGIPTSGYGAQSIPIGIPGGLQRGSIGSLSQSPPSPFGSFSHGLLTGNQKQESGEPNISLLGYHNHNKFSDVNSMSPRSGPGGPHSPLYSSSNLSNSSQGADMQKLREEFQHYKTRQEHWEQAYSQAKSACEAWKREAEESLRKAKSAEEEKAQAVKQRDEALGRISKIQLDLEKMGGGSNSVRLLHQVNEIEKLPIPQLRQIQQQLRMDMDKLDKVIMYQQNLKCIMCQDRNRSITCVPCNHRVMCEACAGKSTECPMCHVQRTNYRL
ncbi:RING finger protein unkempt homolog isoform X1 [Saccostrea echinata]|uniref:RING finger protein unkempt homolog isoform X1 n=1 Tax=Saccostrea echinata TaxID=191078 RepID=UPI002A81386F|nr:RING finger protein unkempt homolog isoform X1 [Saccostrea echinata]